jgi:inner membrane transporter RhtA
VLLSEHLSVLQWLAIVAIIVAAAGTALTVGRPVAVEELA